MYANVSVTSLGLLLQREQHLRVKAVLDGTYNLQFTYQEAAACDVHSGLKYHVTSDVEADMFSESGTFLIGTERLVDEKRDICFILRVFQMECVALATSRPGDSCCVTASHRCQIVGRARSSLKN
jgi:hypothetical protein